MLYLRVAMLALFALTGTLIGLSISFQKQRTPEAYRQDNTVKLQHEAAHRDHVFTRLHPPFGSDLSR